MAGACRPRPSRRWAKAVFDDDVRSLQSVAPNARQCDGIATAGPALEARGRSTMAGDNPATDGDRSSASAAPPVRGALANDRGALCRGAAQLDKIPWSGRRWLARRNRGSVHRQGASPDPRTSGARVDSWGAGTPCGAWPLGLLGSLHQACRPACISPPPRARGGRGRADSRNGRRRHPTDRDAGRLRDVDGFFEGVQTTLQLLSRPLSVTRRHSATLNPSSVVSASPGNPDIVA